MRKIVKKLVPESILSKIKRIFNQIQLYKDYRKDMKRYSKYSLELSKERSQRHLETDLIFFYHKIEKGLSLPNPRVGFGKGNVNYLLEQLKKYQATYGWDYTAQVSLNALYSYYEFNKQHGLVLEDLLSEIEHLKKGAMKSSNNGVTMGGVSKVKKKEIKNTEVNFKDFANTRYSIRNFSKGRISKSTIEEAVMIAQKTPSVCNRQSSKVYIYEGEDKDKVLKHQNGNAGFGNDADKVLLITVELKDFRGPKERNQAFIDGGLYSMSLIYALHSLGVGTCALNLSLSHNDELKLKKEARIPESEVTIMMIAIGEIPEEFYVADSPRREIKDVLVM